MPINLEVKARLVSADCAVAVANSIGASFSGILTQTDTYFFAPTGRFKLRQCATAVDELIYYDREEQSDCRLSKFYTYPVQESDLLRELLEQAFGILGIVRKHRTLYLFEKTTRIHVDEIDCLGTFIEFEIPVTTGAESRSDERMNMLLMAFSIQRDTLIQHSYIDLMLARNDANGVSTRGGELRSRNGFAWAEEQG